MIRLLTLLLFSVPLAAHAGAIDKLKTFIATTHSARANFTQQVLDQNGNQIQNASGIMEFQRPGKFRWTYQKPYEQLIVGDGTKFWLYDADLNQVTVRKLDTALGSSPAALLSGSNEIERGFALTEDGSRDGLEWLQATPKGKPDKTTQLQHDTDGLQRAGRPGRDGTERHVRAQDGAAFFRDAAQSEDTGTAVSVHPAQGCRRSYRLVPPGL